MVTNYRRYTYWQLFIVALFSFFLILTPSISPADDIVRSGDADYATTTKDKQREFSYKFDDNSRVVFIIDDGIYYESGKTRKLLLTTKPDTLNINFPQSETKSLPTVILDNNSAKTFAPILIQYQEANAPYISIRVENRIYVVLKNGTLATLPSSSLNLEQRALRVQNAQNSPKYFYRDTSKETVTSVNGQTFYLLIYADLFTHNRHAFIVREDGASLSIENLPKDFIYSFDALSPSEPVFFRVNNSIAYNLQTFEKVLDRPDDESALEESRFQNLDKKITDAEGRTSTVREVVEKFFPEIGTELASDNKIYEPSFPEEIKNIRKSLLKRENGFTLVVGEAGSGKTELVKSFIKKVKNGEFPEIPKYTRFLEVRAASLSGGTKYTGTFESRVNALAEYARNNPVVLYIDEAHSLRGAGRHSGNENDFFEYIKSYLADGSIKILGTTTNEDAQMFVGDSALSRRISRVDKASASPEMILAMMREWSKKQGLPALSDNSYERVRDLAAKFDPTGSHVSKATKLLDTVYADTLVEGKDPTSLSPRDIELIASQTYNIPMAFFDPNLRPELLSQFEKDLNSRVFGMNEVKELLKLEARLLMTQLNDPTKPQGRILFSGPKGLGKTYIPRVYAESIGLPFYRISMPQYVGKSPQDFLNEVGQQIRKNPFTVFLFDEIEKTPSYIQNTLLAFLDDKTVTLEEGSLGRNLGAKNYVRVDTSHTTIFFGTNAGANATQEKPSIGFLAQEKEVVSPKGNAFVSAMLADGLSEYLIDRCRNIVPFVPPQTAEEYSGVLKLQMANSLKEIYRLQKETLTPEEQETIIQEVVARHFKPGASFRVGLDEMDKLLRHKMSERVLGISAVQNNKASKMEALSCSALF